MDLRVLGPVEASVDDRPVVIGAGKPRALLAMLALSEGSPVSSERLIDGLWGEQPPATAPKMVQVYVSQLRNALAGWRGPPLDDVSSEPFAALEIRRLEELRAAAVEQAIEQDLAAGRHAEVLGELETLVAHERLRERLHGQRMMALYRSGRQADALEAYRHARAALVEAIGVEPGPELRGLHEAILRQDPSLDLPEPDAVDRVRAREEWRADSARRLEGSADRAAAERARQRAAEEDLADDVVQLQAARERVGEPSADLVACPFKGLASFDVDDADVFYGRERLVAE